MPCVAPCLKNVPIIRKMDSSETENSSLQEKAQTTRQRRDFVLALLSLIVCATMPVSALIGSQSSFGRLNDFPEYYAAAKMIKDGRGADIYKLDELFKVQHECFPSMEGRGIAFYIPPFAVPLLFPLAFLPPLQSYWLFMSGSLGCLFAAVFALKKNFDLSTNATLWMLTGLCASAPLFESLKIAQLAPFLFAGFSFFLLLSASKKDLISGICLSSLLLKPQELLPISIYVLFSARFKIIATLIATYIVLAILSVSMLGLEGYSNYAALLKDSTSNTQFMQPELSATIRGQLLRIPGISNGLANWISLFSLFSVSLLIAITAIRCQRDHTLPSTQGSLRTSWFKQLTNWFTGGSKRSPEQKSTRPFEKGLLLLSLPLGLLSALHCHDYDLLLLLPWVIALWKLNPGSRRHPVTLDSQSSSGDPDEELAGFQPASIREMPPEWRRSQGVTNKILYASKITNAFFLFTVAVPVYIPIHYTWLLNQNQAFNPIFVFFAISAVSSALATWKSRD